MSNGQSLNILYMLPELNVGGVETHVTALSAGMTRLGHRVTIVSNGGVLVPRLEEQGVEHITMPVHRKSPAAIRWDMASKIRSLVKDKNIQVVHAHSRVPAWIAHFALRNTKVAFVISAHGQYAPHYGSKVMARGDSIICVSRGILDHMRDKLNADENRMQVVYNGINMEQSEAERAACRPADEVRAEFGIDPSVPVVGSIGRLTTTKGQKYFIETCARLAEKRPDLKALIVGDGPMKKELQDRAAELEIEKNLIFTGVRTDVYDILQILDAYVVSSIFEGFPMGCLEAMSARVPIVATRVGGIPEMVEHERTALLVEAKEPDALAGQIERILADRSLGKNLAEAGYDDVVHKFSETRMISDVLEVYYNTIRGKRGYVGPVRGLPKVEKPRILITLPELRVGGVETHVVDLTSGLKDKGYNPMVVSFGGKLVEKLKDAGVEHVRLPVHSKSPLVILSMVNPFMKVIEEYGAEVIHAHSRVPAWISYMALSRMKNRLPFVTTCHSTYGVHVGSRVMVWSDQMIAVSEFVRRHMVKNFGTDPERIHPVHNGVSPDLYDAGRAAAMNKKYREEMGIGASAKVVGMVASLTPRKGYIHFIRAAAKIQKEYGDVMFLGVGGGPQLEELESRVREEGLDGRFRFLGVRSDVRDLLSLFDVFVLSSSSEGLPYVILEAMCMNRPVVSTGVGGIPEAIRHGENGMLVDTADDMALADCILELITNEDYAARLGAAARETAVKSFSVQNMVDRTEDVYRKVIQ